MKRCQMIDFLVRAAIPNVTEKDRLPRKEGIIENSNLLCDFSGASRCSDRTKVRESVF